MAVRPIRLTDPWITLGTDSAGPPVTTQADLDLLYQVCIFFPEEDDAAATFCDPLGFTWVLTLDLKMSVGPDSLDEALSSLGGPGTVIPFEFAYRNAPAAADNPHWSGEVRLVAWAVVDSGINEVTEINLEMDVIGDISRDDGAGAFVMSTTGTHHHASSQPAATEPEQVAA